MTTLPNWLLISGSGRNVGKTSLICRIIHEMKDLKPVAIKISSHLHTLPEDSDWIIRKEDYSLIRETQISSKDSSKMLQSGADTVYYGQGPDYRLKEILSAITELTSGQPVICESGGLRKFIVPGLYLLIKGDENHVKPGISGLENLADKVLSVSDIRNGNFENKLIYKNNCWLINK